MANLNHGDLSHWFKLWFKSNDFCQKSMIWIIFICLILITFYTEKLNTNMYAVWKCSTHSSICSFCIFIEIKPWFNTSWLMSTASSGSTVSTGRQVWILYQCLHNFDLALQFAASSIIVLEILSKCNTFSKAWYIQFTSGGWQQPGL